MPITFLTLLAHDTLTNAVAIVLLLIAASTPTLWTSHPEAGLPAAAALEVGAATSVQPSLYVRQQLFWSSRVRGGVRKPKLLDWMNPQSRFWNHGWTYTQLEVHPSKPDRQLDNGLLRLLVCLSDHWPLGPLAPSFYFTASAGSLEEATLSLQTILGSLPPHFLPSPTPFTSARPLSSLLFSCFSVTLHHLPTLSKPLLSTSSAPGIMQSPEDSEPRGWW